MAKNVLGEASTLQTTEVEGSKPYHSDDRLYKEQLLTSPRVAQSPSQSSQILYFNKNFAQNRLLHSHKPPSLIPEAVHVLSLPAITCTEFNQQQPP